MAVDCPLLITSILLAKSSRSIYGGAVFSAVSWPKSLLVHVWAKQLLKAKSETGSLDRWMGTPCTALSTRAPVILIKMWYTLRIDNVVAQLVAQFLY